MTEPTGTTQDDSPPPEEEPIPPVFEPVQIEWEPQTYYKATAVCLTPGCPQEHVVVNIPMLYSNNGLPAYIRVQCGSSQCCGKDCMILTAEKLDPQPPEE